MRNSKKSKSLGVICEELALCFHGARIPTSTLSAFRARGVDITDPDEVVGAVYYNERKPIWFDRAYKARVEYWALIEKIRENHKPAN